VRILINVIALLVLCTTAQAAGSDAKGSRGYPEIGRLEGSTIKKYQAVDFDEYRIFTAPVKNRQDRDNYTTLEGRITRIAYYAPNGVSILEAQCNYENRLSRTLGISLPGWAFSGAWRPRNGGFRMVSCSTGGCRLARDAVSGPPGSAPPSAPESKFLSLA